MGLLVLVRLTNIVIVLPLSIYVVLQNKKYIVPLVLGAIPAIISMLYMNQLFYGSMFSTGYIARTDFHWTTSYFESLPGYFVSPARGFLFLSPPLLLGFIALFKFKNLSLLYKTFIVICVLQILVMGKWWAWEGANAFEARMLTEILPFLFILTVEMIKNIKSRAAFLLLVWLTTHHHSTYINQAMNLQQRQP